MSAKLKRFIAQILATALIAVAPGLAPYQAVAAITGKVPSSVARPGINGAAGASGLAASGSTLSGTTQIQVTLESTLGSLPSLPTNPLATGNISQTPTIAHTAAASPAGPSAVAASQIHSIKERAPPALIDTRVSQDAAAAATPPQQATTLKVSAKKIGALKVQTNVRDTVTGKASASSLMQLYHGARLNGDKNFAHDDVDTQGDPSYRSPAQSGLQAADEILATGADKSPVDHIIVEASQKTKADAHTRKVYGELRSQLNVKQNSDAATAEHKANIEQRLTALEALHPELKSFPARIWGGITKRLADIKEIYAGFNKSEKAFIVGQAVFLLALSIYLASLPLLVKALTGDAAMTGVARAVHYWVFAGASLFSGAIAKRTPMKSILVGGAGARAMIFGSIGILALMGMLPWYAFLVLVGINAAIISVNHLVDIDTDGARKVFSSDKKIEQAGYIYDFIFYGMMLIVPPLIGIPMDLMDQFVGPGIGAAVGFTAFAAIMGVAAYIYIKSVHVIHEKTAGARESLASFAAGVRALFTQAFWKNTLNATRPNHLVGLGLIGAGVVALFTAGGTLLSLASGVGLIGFGVIGLLHWATVKSIFSSRAILSRFGIETGVVFLDDAFFNVVIPTFAIDILLVGAFGNGLLLAAGTFGGLLASLFLMNKAQKLQARMGTYRFLAVLTGVASLAFIPSMGLWLVPSLAVAMVAVALVKILEQPLRSRMRALLQTQIKNDPIARAQSENIFALMTVFEVFAAGLGGVLFAWLFKNAAAGGAVFATFGDLAPMKVVTLMLAALAPVFIGGFMVLRKDLPRWKQHYAHGDFAAPRGLGWLNRVLPRAILGRLFTSKAELKEMAKLEANLEVVGYPQAKTIRVSEEVDGERPTVAILAPPSVHKLPIIHEGGQQSAGDVHLVMDPSWLIQEVQPDGTTRPLLKKGLFFDEQGQPYIAEYDVPRPVRYFANFFTEGANERTDGNVFEYNNVAPQSNSLQLEKTTNDKLLTRMWMAAKGVAVPATLAFLLNAHPLTNNTELADAADAVSVAQLPQGEDAKADIRAALAAHIAANRELLGKEVVVKPSGPNWHSSKGVEFFDITDIDAMADHILALSKAGDMTPDGAILIDQRITPPPLYFSGEFVDSNEAAHKAVASGEADTWGIRLNRPITMKMLSAEQIAKGEIGNTMKDVNFGIYAARGPDGKAIAAGEMNRAGKWGSPTVGEPGGPNGSWDIEEAAAIVKIEDIIGMLQSQHGLLQSPEEVADFRATLYEYAEAALDAINSAEKDIPRNEGEPFNAHTDFVRLDVMLDFKDGKLTPMVIEVNDHDSGGQHFVDHFYPDEEGKASKDWVSTMLAEARRDALKGKRIIIVGAGYEGKRFVFERAKELGVNIVLIDKPGSWAADLVEEYIEVETLSLSNRDAAREVEEALEARGLKNAVDGISSFWEDDVPLTAKIAENLDLDFFSYRSAVSARNKTATRGLMAKAGLPAVRFHRIGREEDLEKAGAHVGFPAVLKPASGAEAKMVLEVRNEVELKIAYAKMMKAVAEEAEWDGAFTTSVGLTLEQFLEGDEVDVDVVMQDGELKFHSITDNWPTERPTFKATGSNLPSILPTDTQAQLLDLAEKTAKAIGLDNGVFHIEMKMTPEGPRLIEANARMGGSYVRDWIKTVWGVDLVEESLMTAAGIDGPIFKPSKPKTHLSGSFLFSGQTGEMEYIEVADATKPGSGFHSLRYEAKPGASVEGTQKKKERVGMVTTQGRSSQEAATRQEAIKANTRIAIRTNTES